MKTNTLVLAKRYAAAYDTLAADTAQASANLEAFKAALSSVKEAQDYINNPTIPFSVKAEILAKILTDGKAASFIKLLVSSGRFYLADFIVSELAALLDQRLGVKRVKVISAGREDETGQAILTDALSIYFKSKVAVEFTQDESLLAGVVVRQGDLRIDGSAAGRIEQLTKNLTER